MEHRYEIEARLGLCITGLVFALMGAGAILLAFGPPGVEHRPETAWGRTAMALGFGGIGMAMAYVGWDHLVRRAWRVTIWPDGRMEFKRAFHTTRLLVSRVAAVERSTRRMGDDDADGRELAIRHVRGTIKLAYFAEIEALLHDVRRLNPYVVERGRWTSDAEPAHSNSSTWPPAGGAG